MVICSFSTVIALSSQAQAHWQTPSHGPTGPPGRSPAHPATKGQWPAGWPSDDLRCGLNSGLLDSWPARRARARVPSPQPGDESQPAGPGPCPWYMKVILSSAAVSSAGSWDDDSVDDDDRKPTHDSLTVTVARA